MSKEYIPLPSDIEMTEELRNGIAYAHGICDSKGNQKFLGTCTYPQRYIVTEEQIEKAKLAIEKRKLEVLEENKNNLLFEGAGCVERGDVENCRIRTRLKNNSGKIIYLELTGFETKQAIQNEVGIKIYAHAHHCFYCDNGGENNIKNRIEIKAFHWAKRHILDTVNEQLNCSFKKLVVDNYNIHVFDTEEPLCESK
jgi:hypothetical protein